MEAGFIGVNVVTFIADKHINGYQPVQLHSTSTVGDTLPLYTSCWEFTIGEQQLKVVFRLPISTWMATVEVDALDLKL